MNILAIDTSTKKANVCLKINDTIIDKSIDNEITHSEKLLPLIDNVLQENNLSLKDMDYLACCIGPGSFTGIRIGIATVKAFAKVLSTPIFTASSLDMFAYSNNTNLPDYIISIMDAKNSRIYYCIYKVEKNKLGNITIPVLKRISDNNNDEISVALDKISSILLQEKLTDKTSINVVGDCTENYKDLFIETLESNTNDINISDTTLSSKSLIHMADNYINLGINKDFEKDYLTLDALYVRPSQAERAKNNEL